MPDNAIRLTILISSETKDKLEELAQKSDLTVSQILRKLLKNHLKDFDALADKPDASGREDSTVQSGARTQVSE